MTSPSAAHPATGLGRRPGESRRRGQWKLAYADFLTALTSLFLILWLSSEASGADRQAIAAYFSGDPTESVDAAASADPFAGLTADPELAAHLSLVRAPHAVTVELADRTNDPLFDLGDATLTETGRRVFHRAGARLAGVGLAYTLEGHTDAFPSRDPQRSNWRLSTERAHAAFDALTAGGLDPNAASAVAGRGARAPLYPAEPHLPANRRVSIVFDLMGEFAPLQ